MTSVFTAAWTVTAAFLLTLAVASVVPTEASPFFLIAVMVSAYRGGYAAGFAATVLSIAADILLVSPRWSFDFQTAELSRIGADVVASILIGTLSASRRRAELEREKLLHLERAARQEAERASGVKDEIVAVVSHELRTPLTTIKTLTHILRFKSPTPDEAQEYLADIAVETDRQIDLVHNLLDLSKIQQSGLELQVRATTVEKVVRDCAKIERIEAAAHLHELVIEVAPNLPPVMADESALRRSICTMLENSIKYTPDGGTIAVRARETGDRRVAIEVSDNGRGIHPDDMPHIFERFFRGHLLPAEGEFKWSADQEIKGIGLGLHLAKILIEGMKGEIVVKSDVGAGSSFTIILNKWSQ